MGLKAKNAQTGSLFDGSKVANAVLHQLMSIALQEPSDPISEAALTQLEHIFSQAANLTAIKLNTIHWNKTGASPSSPSLALLVIQLARRHYPWALQLINAIVEHVIEFNWNQTTTDGTVTGKTTPLLLLSMTANDEQQWAKDLLLKVLTQNLSTAIPTTTAPRAVGNVTLH